MSDEEQRRLERQAQDDALAAGRLAMMQRRLGDGVRLLPVVILAQAGDGIYRGRHPRQATRECRAWLLPSPPHATLILDEDWRDPDGRDHRRGAVIFASNIREGMLRVPEWFLGAAGE